MTSAIVPWYAPAVLDEKTWQSSCWLDDIYSDYYKRALKYPIETRFVCDFFAKHIAGAEFGNFPDKGDCIPAEFPKWYLEINTHDSSIDQQAQDLALQVTRAFYRERGIDYLPYEKNIILQTDLSDKLLWDPKGLSMAGQHLWKGMLTEKLSQNFYIRYTEYIKTFLDHLKNNPLTKK